MYPSLIITNPNLRDGKTMVLLLGGLGAGGGKVTMGPNRRALSTINGNIVEAPAYPCKVHKRNGITE